MVEKNPHRLKASGPIDSVTGFPHWFEDDIGVALEIVTRPDPVAPAIGETQTPGAPVVFPDNFPEEAFYFMAEARLEAGGNGVAGRARVIMALEAAFGGDGSPTPDLGVVFARLRVRIDDVIPGAEYIVRHPYGTTHPLPADERGRVSYTCDLGLAEGNMERVLVTGQIAPFVTWADGAPAGYIGDGVRERPIVNGPFRNHVEIEGPRIGEGSADASGTDLVRKELFVVQGRLRGTDANARTPPLGGPGISVLEILGAEYRTSRAQYRVRGRIIPVAIADPNGGFTSDRVDVTLNGQAIGSAFPDVTGAWEVRKTLPGATPSVPGVLSRVQVKTASGESSDHLLIVRN